MRKLLGSLCLLASALSANASAEDLPVILQRMNQQAASLRGMSSDIQMITYTAIIDSKITEDGTLKMQKTKDGVRAIMDFSKLKDSARVVGFFGKIARMYYPNAKYYQDYDVGKNGDLINQFLLLGFGTSGDELSKSYTISLEGTEKLSSSNTTGSNTTSSNTTSSKTTRLMLIPKDPKVKEHLSKVEIWIPEGEANPVQQKFFEEPSGNYYLASYSNMNFKPSFKGQLEIKMPPGTSKH